VKVWLREVRRENHAAHRRKSAAMQKIVVNEDEEDDGEPDVGNGEAIVDKMVVYDHAQCNDCGCVHTMVTECVMQLAAKTLQVSSLGRFVCVCCSFFLVTGVHAWCMSRRKKVLVGSNVC
jgi:hypothetical protein